MGNSKDIQTKIAESIDSLAGIARAMPSLNLYTSKIARTYNLENSFWEKTSKTISRSAFALISVSIVLPLIFGHKSETSFRKYIKANIFKKASMIQDLWKNQPGL